MVCEATTGYICNMEIYTAEGKKLEETIFSVSEPNIDLWHYVYSIVWSMQRTYFPEKPESVGPSGSIGGF
jgi:hypothetical protein